MSCNLASSLQGLLHNPSRLDNIRFILDNNPYLLDNNLYQLDNPFKLDNSRIILVNNTHIQDNRILNTPVKAPSIQDSQRSLVVIRFQQATNKFSSATSKFR